MTNLVSKGLPTLLAILCISALTGIAESAARPNFIIIFTDDQGYQDLGCFGSPQIRTPNLDRMAAEGIRFTDFYVGAAVCSASRACLLTGRYSGRNGVGGVFFPDLGGMNPEETTVAEVLSDAGYATACFGKWHLGDRTEYLPTNQGFDAYFGVPYSNDMWIGPSQRISPQAVFREGWDLDRTLADQKAAGGLKSHPKRYDAFAAADMKDKSPLMEGIEIVEYPADQATLTRRYFDRAIDFIDGAGEKPFLIYLTPTMPHVPLFASGQFEGSSKQGLYGDVIEEIDWNVGRLLDHLAQTGADENTLVIYASDNGPWLSRGDQAGCALPLRDGKFSNYEGGIRTPTLARWPGTIPAGVVSGEVGATIDLLPTLTGLARADLPEDVIIDGVDLSAHLVDPTQAIGRADGYFIFNKTEVVGIRQGEWKYLRHGGMRRAGPDTPPELYNLAEDISETTNLAEANPSKVAELDRLVTAFAETL